MGSEGWNTLSLSAASALEPGIGRDTNQVRDGRNALPTDLSRSSSTAGTASLPKCH